jgi:FAD/FMN-containing dehydrogenase
VRNGYKGGQEGKTKKEDLIAIVGADNVADDAQTLESYSRDQSFTAPRKPWFVVRPQNTEEVTALVIWANESQTALVPVSSGAPHFHGDTVPSLPEAVIVDLSRARIVILLSSVSIRRRRARRSKSSTWWSSSIS